jgi:hypothetical protein
MHELMRTKVVVGLSALLAIGAAVVSSGAASAVEGQPGYTLPLTTNITGTPSNPSNLTHATFSFTGDGTGFECKLDTGNFSACTSPKTYSGLAGGSHTVQVRAVDATGNVDSSPASFTWTIDLATRPGIVRASTERFLKSGTTGGAAVAGSFFYGAKPLTPLVGDWDGNGTKTPGSFEAGVFKLRNSNSAGDPDLSFAFGDPRGFPVAGDFNGDGVDDVAVFRSGLWQVRYSTGQTPATFNFGSGSWPTTVPLAGDWNGDGTDGVGVFAAGTWTLRSLASGAGVNSTVTFGPGTSPYPVVGDWNGDGVDTVGVKAATGTTWRLTNSAASAPSVEITFEFGQANTDLPFAWR